ncbi:MAG: hypothetical protein NC039_03040 [Muribaculaceae bacterium]|nr:hypothetical protein [Muribaculaceae bacterium]
MIRNLKYLLAACGGALLMQGCFFTGVESTPKITAGDVRRAETPLTREDTFLSHVADEPLRSWRPGKRFVVADRRISRVFGLDEAAGDSLDGKTLYFEGATESVGVTGSGVTDLVFREEGGRSLVYRLNRPLASMQGDRGVTVPFTIQADMVMEADRALRGKHVYTLTGIWRDDADTPVKGLKFIPVTIDSVSAGNSLFPLKVSFTSDTEGVSGRLFIYPGGRDDAPRTFGSVFSFSDPRRRYPSISDATWDNIVHGRVVLGMTLDECRLSLGAPKEILRGASQSYLRETWSYENGHYLLFEDGELKMIR